MSQVSVNRRGAEKVAEKRKPRLGFHKAEPMR